MFDRLKILFAGSGLRAFVLRGFVGNILLKVSNTLLILAVAIVLARMLGPEGYGIYAFAYAVVSLLAIPAQVGLPTLVVREVAKYQVRQEWDRVVGLLRMSNLTVLGLSVALMLVAAVLATLAGETIDRTQVETVFWALILVPLLGLGKLRGAALRGLQKVVQGHLPEMLLIPAIHLLLIVCALSLGEISAPIAMGLHSLAAGIGFVIGVVLLMRSLPDAAKVARPNYEFAVWLPSILPLSLIAGMQLINSQAGIVILGILSTSSEVGYYRVAVQGANIVSLSLIAINAAIAPQITRLYQTQDMIRLQRMITWTSRGILATSLPIALALIVFGESILQFVFGAEYRQAHLALAILCVGQLVNATMGSVVFLLNMTGHERDTAKGLLVAAIGNILLGVLLVPRYGIEGAALATTVSVMSWNILLSRQVKRRLGIDSTAINRLPKKSQPLKKPDAL